MAVFYAQEITPSLRSAVISRGDDPKAGIFYFPIFSDVFNMLINMGISEDAAYNFFPIFANN